MLDASVRVSRIACGGACTAVVDDAGGLWTWGSNSWGQCGQSGAGEDELEPRRVASLEAVHVSEVSVGEDHMVAVARDGAVFSWGRACNGRLGSDVPLGHLTEAMAATAQAATARGTTPARGRGRCGGAAPRTPLAAGRQADGRTDGRTAPLAAGRQADRRRSDNARGAESSAESSGASFAAATAASTVPAASLSSRESGTRGASVHRRHEHANP